MKYVRLVFRILISIVPWALMFTLTTFLIMVGWVIIPIAAVCRAFESSRSNRDGREIVKWSAPLIWLWGNDEDGVLGGRQYKDFKSDILQAIYWTALRNPVNNLRFVPKLSCKINPMKVRFEGTFASDYERGDIRVDPTELKIRIKMHDTKVPHWFFAWQGIYSNFYWQFNLFGLRRFWIGWKIYPTDIYGIVSTNYRYHGTGFAIQFKRVK